MSFRYERTQLVADFYLLGHARKTGAFVIVAWCIEPVQEWRHLRYSHMLDLEPIGQAEAPRPDFNPYPTSIATIDTMAAVPLLRHA